MSMRARSLARLIVLALCAPLGAQAQAAHAIPSGVSDYFRRLQPEGPAIRGTVVFRDLNGDGTPEVLIYVQDNRYCGSGGCNFYVFERVAKSYKKIGGTTVTEPPIRVLSTMYHGWHDLGVGVKGDAAEPDHEVRLRFSDNRYGPSNPSLAPPLVKAGGEVVIAPGAQAAPLW